MNHPLSVRSASRRRAPARLAFALAGVVLLAGCAGLRPAESEPAVIVPAVSLPDGSVRGDTGDERVAELWFEADEAYRRGDDPDALERLYEGLELDPRNSLFWSRAAEIQLRNAEPAEAENFAVKSNAFAAENPSLLYRNWLIIETARDMRGDLLGVRSAHKKVQQYQYR